MAVAEYYLEEYRTIGSSFAAGELGFLVGAGMSADEGGPPAGAAMSQKMLRRAVLGDESDSSHPSLDKLATKYPFEAVAQYLTSKLTHHDFSHWLSEKGGLAAATPKNAHRSLHELYVQQQHRFPKHIFTTNFDTLIEDAFAPNEAICITSENIADLVDARKENRVAVVHLHGCIKYPKSIIVGELQLATSEGPVFDLLRGALAVDTFVLVGYSMADTNLRNVFFEVQRIASTRYGLSKRTFAVSKADGDPTDKMSEAGVARRIWQQRGVDHIAATAGVFFQTLFDAVDSFVMVNLRKIVAQRLGKDEATLDKMLESACAPFGVLKPADILIYLYYALVPPIGEKK
jgi:hypothetical protein